MKKTQLYSLGVMLGLLTACGSSSPPPTGVKIGKPYSINGKMYYPEYDPGYNETGVASWYGPGFHGKMTANGETFDTHDLTAAHPTLPMPSLVRVTNLDNGKNLVVRINDRGPFAKGRIIDLSRESAQRLGITGLGKVRVQYMKKESEDYITAMKAGQRLDMAAFNEGIENDRNATILVATAPSDQNFIVETIHNESRPGDTMNNAAPIVSVAESDLPGNARHQVVAQNNTPPVGAKGKEVILHSPNIQVTQTFVNPLDQQAALPVGGGYFVQVGSFSQQANADSMQRRIDQFARSSVALVEVKGRQWWRLRAGPFKDNNEAQVALAKIRESGVPDARILTE